MGFFSSRKAEDNESYQLAIGVGRGATDKSSVVQVIRSRFYGKKGKEREEPPPSFLSGVSTAQVLSPSTPSGPSSVAGTPIRGVTGILRNQAEASLPTTPSKKRAHHAPPDSPTPSRINDASGFPLHLQHSKTMSVNSTSISPRKNTDVVTATLAQRLNELSVANSEGLLTDDEYRILRQNLFERFSSNATIPIEAPLVPASPQARPRRVGQVAERPPSRPLSNFHVERPLSVNSKTSGVSGMADLLRRATGRRSNSKDLSDTASIWSSKSNTSYFRIPGLTRKSSSNSLRTDTSPAQDTISLSSKRQAGSSDRSHSEFIKSPNSRSTGSIRKLTAPPSSFPGGRTAIPEVRTVNSMYNLQDEEHLISVKDITQEIANMEAEAKRLMDAFSGLEVTTLAKSQRARVRPSLRSADFMKNGNGESNWGIDSDTPSQRRINLADDSISMRSGTSIGTTPSLSPSIARSAYSTKKVGRPKLPINSSIISPTSRPGSLHRKNSTSSVSSEKRIVKLSSAPPVPALPSAISQIHHLKGASVSNISLARSTGHIPMNTVPEDEHMSMSGTIKSLRLDEEAENEMDDIRARREEVSRRYEARLEYLRAKLKGAQLHEKLMRKYRVDPCIPTAFAGIPISLFGVNWPNQGVLSRAIDDHSTYGDRRRSLLSSFFMAHYPPPGTDDSGDYISSTPTPAPSFPHLHRTVSRSSTWSATDTPAHHNEGTSYFPSHPSSPTTQFHPSPILRNTSVHSQRRTGPGRSTSVSSSQATNRGYRDDDALSEQDEDENNEDDDDEALLRSHRRGKAPAVPDDGDEDENADDPITTLKDRQSLINVQHPFGLPIWKPALYKKSRSVTRHADEALHSVPSAQAERHLLPGNLFWAIAFGWWLGLLCVLLSGILYILPQGEERYSNLVYGLGWYIFWPFGKYVEGDVYESDDAKQDQGDEDEPPHLRRWSDSNTTVRGVSPPRGETTDRRPPLSEYPTITPDNVQPNVRFTGSESARETTALLRNRSAQTPSPIKSYGTAPAQTPTPSSDTAIETYREPQKGNIIGKLCFWLFLLCIIAPLMLFVCLICWGLVVTIPMAKLNWALLKHLIMKPTQIRLCAAPPVVVVTSPSDEHGNNAEVEGQVSERVAQFSVKHTRLSEGQAAPSGSPTSTVLLCTYRAVGFQYYKYTVGGVNILFVNLMPVVFFVIFDGFVLLPLVERKEHNGEHVPPFLAFIASQALIFILSLTSVIPLSYFIGMAVASISAQSSIGMGAVINATFGSIIEIILYAIALTQNKGHLVEGSIVGSLLAGVLLMPGMSMCSGALRRKEQKFNAKSAGVTSMMLIMAIIGALTPTLFYQTYGNFQLVCSGCPSSPKLPGDAPWICDHCYYKHPDPVDDPFYQSTVKNLMYFCACILVFSYLVGLWFSLRTHASQIWQNPQQLLQSMELPTHTRMSLYNKILHPTQNTQLAGTLHRKSSNAVANQTSSAPSRTETPLPPNSAAYIGPSVSLSRPTPTASPTFQRKVSYNVSQQPNFLPVLESVDHAVENTDLQNMHLSGPMTTDDFTRAVAVATVSALRHQQTHAHAGKVRGGEHEASGGHDAPSWSRTTSASVLLACTALYAIIAELLVDVVDVILEDSGIDEKFLGITLFALVPNTTEFMNAISFALNGNIALSMEIGSAYALQVCLLQIPAMVAFSAWYDPVNMGEVAKTFSLIFPRWDVIVIILSMFIMTYTYIEAKSNYHRGSILILSYLVLTSGFYFAPPTAVDIDQGHFSSLSDTLQEFPALPFIQNIRWWLTSLL